LSAETVPGRIFGKYCATLTNRIRAACGSKSLSEKWELACGGAFAWALRWPLLTGSRAESNFSFRNGFWLSRKLSKNSAVGRLELDSNVNKTSGSYG
jgi:hypothetical protein